MAAASAASAAETEFEAAARPRRPARTAARELGVAYEYADDSHEELARCAAAARSFLAAAALARGDARAARGRLDEGLRLSAALEDARSVAAAHANLGFVHRALAATAATALAAADTLTWTAALAAANADLDAAGVVKTVEDDGALAGRFVDLLRLVAFARTDIITTRGAAAALPADAAGKKHRDRLRLQDPLEVGRDLGAVLTRRTSAQLRYACLETYVHLVASTSDADESAPRPERAFPFLVAEE